MEVERIELADGICWVVHFFMGNVDQGGVVFVE